LGPNAGVVISQSDAQLAAPRGFRKGDAFTLSDLARLTLTASLNDGAAALVEATATHTNTSVGEVLASAASSLGLTSTYALNGSGLDISAVVSGGYGSAHDIALLAGALASHYPEVALATTNHLAVAVSRSGKKFTAVNTNPDVLTAPRLLLSKTGFTDLAGGNLVIVFDAGIGHPIAIVVLGSSRDARFADVNTLVDATLAHFAQL
jgi:D-alanyl-D-alanine carboxypeptidase